MSHRRMSSKDSFRGREGGPAVSSDRAEMAMSRAGTRHNRPMARRVGRQPKRSIRRGKAAGASKAARPANTRPKDKAAPKDCRGEKASACGIREMALVMTQAPASDMPTAPQTKAE